jgi:hypothetical protein
MQLVTKHYGSTIELRYHDVPLFTPAKARATIAAIMRQHVALALEDIAGHISDEAPIGVSGQLAQSFAGSANGGIEVLGQEIEDISGRVFSSLPYAVVIDQGRAPGARMPPVDAIMLWVERVLGIQESDDTELEDVAWAIARSIGKKGIAPRYFVERGLQKALPRVEGVLGIMAHAIALALVDPSGGGRGGSPRFTVVAPSGGVGL